MMTLLTVSDLLRVEFIASAATYSRAAKPKDFS
jgi:hypothetical protein